MSDNETPPTPRTPVRPLGRGRVRALSQHFETLQSEQEKYAKRYRQEIADEAAAEASSPKKTTVYTGEFRVPLAKRLEDLRIGEKKRADRPRGSIEFPSNPPPTPMTPVDPKWRLEAECPSAPVKSLALRRLSRNSLAVDHNDHLFDRKANRPHLVLQQKSSIDSVSERREKNNTTPHAPSPLRNTFSLPSQSESEEEDN
ncbi:hypothetical protein GGR53DRAFT_529265 [Hypoxylon sp. FL1150]|nr:hypothetical protein GGR53DRAFT_529265 [Hypoxylon sp. FL1150]